MDVKPVDTGTQFKGYVDKSLIKFVRSNVKAGCYTLAEDAATCGRTVKPEEITRIKDLGEDIIKRLWGFMAKLHEDTALAFRKTRGGRYSTSGLEIYLKNPITKKVLTLASSNNPTFNSSALNHNIGGNLNVLDAMADKLLARQTKSLDEFFGECAAGDLCRIGATRKLTFIDKFFAKRKAKKLDEYSKAIGSGRTNHVEALDKELQYNIELVEHDARKKLLMSDNRIIINKILNK